jgi:hypothetical protein
LFYRKCIGEASLKNRHAKEGIQEGPILMQHAVLSFQYSNKVSSPSASPSVVAKPPDSTLLKNTSAITTKLQPGITVTSDTFTPPPLPKHKLVPEDKQWHESRTEYSKLTQHYLMLSKIRLTCKYNNL